MKLKLAQFGISHDHAAGKAQVLQKSDQVDFCGVFEPSPEVRATLGSNPVYADVHWFSSAAEVLADESILGIAAQGRVSENLSFARQALEHNKHVWLDKPAGDDLAPWHRWWDRIGRWWSGRKPTDPRWRAAHRWRRRRPLAGRPR